MGVYDAFVATWSKAHATFGDGIPQPGTTFDQSADLRRLQADTQSAAPTSQWRGGAASAYSAKNADQARTLGVLADLDTRLGAEVDQSAAVVTRGRGDLDAVKKWVATAAASAPRTAAGEQMLLPVVSKGSGDIASIVRRSHSDLAAIAALIRAISAEYAKLSGPKEGAAGEQPASGMGWEQNGPGIPAVPDSTLDLEDIVRLEPGALGPNGHMELVPGSGVWVPDPGSRTYRPHPPRAPLDYHDIEYIPPIPDSSGKLPLGPSGYMELVPGSGAWVPDPSSPTYQPGVPEAPVDLDDIEFADPELLVPSTMVELWPRSGVLIPDPNLGLPR